MRILITIAVLAACREGHTPSGTPRRDGSLAVSAKPVPAGPSGAAVPEAAAAPSDRRASGPPPASSPPASPPPGSPALVPVPAEVAAQVRLREVIRGLARPVLIVAAPDDPRRRLFIVEQRGKIRILERGKLRPRPFFTIGNLSDGPEQGLLGLAFHPRFAENGRLYVNYTAADGATHIVEYRVSPEQPDAVDPRSAREIIRIAQPYSNHNGGNLLFGPDGKLYTGMGDGGSAGDPQRNGQNPRALLAKILRFDVDAAAPAPEIVHLGVRNPWRFWFDARSSALYIGDVGQNLWESVYVVASDGVQHNFGWNVVEGNHCFRAATCDGSKFTPPAADYPHEQGCSVTGGVTYHGKALPVLDGRYFYADYCTGLLRSFAWTHDPSSPTAPGWIRDHWDWKAAIDPTGLLQDISSFGVDADGEIYLVKLSGTIYQLAPRS